MKMVYMWLLVLLYLDVSPRERLKIEELRELWK